MKIFLFFRCEPKMIGYYHAVDAGRSRETTKKRPRDSPESADPTKEGKS